MMDIAALSAVCRGLSRLIGGDVEVLVSREVIASLRAEYDGSDRNLADPNVVHVGGVRFRGRGGGLNSGPNITDTPSRDMAGLAARLGVDASYNASGYDWSSGEVVAVPQYSDVEILHRIVDMIEK